MGKIPQKVIIPGTDDLYLVTIDGDVFRVGNTEPVKRYQFGERYFVRMSVNGKTVSRSVSGIMRQCYFNSTKLPLTHKGSRSDFSYWNLVPAYTNVVNPTRRKPVVMIKGNEIKFYSSITQCAKESYMSPRNIAKICNNPGRTTRDGIAFLWEKDYNYGEGEKN